MDYNNDWYERYQMQSPQQNTPYSQGRTDSPGRRGRTRKGVSVTALICCMLAAVLLGAGLGVGFSKRYVDSAIESAALSVSLQDSASSGISASAAAPASVPSGAAALPSAEAALASGLSPVYSKAQIIELCAPAVVGIDVTYTVSGYGYGFGMGGAQTATGSGSGIILTSDGYIVTCNHVVDGAETITVVLNDDAQYSASVSGTDPRNDLAVLKIEATGLTPATLGDSDMLTVGEGAIAIGNPLGELRGTATSGIISALGREVTVENTKMTLIQTDAAISPGNSGGGLFNESGSLVGIVNAKASSNNSEGLGFAIPVNSVKQIIFDLKDHGYVRGRAYLGVQTQNVTLQSGQSGWGDNSFFGSFFGAGGTNCVQVTQVVSGSAAEKAGLCVGDLILKVDDTEISSNNDLSAAITGYNAGDTATLTIRHGDTESTVTVTFGEYSPSN